ncbi:acyl-CoA ligase FadD12 [Microlunatus panaciterrae]|uniref:Fatty-acyl-CoA synthase n=1 Tax=Microlunatus panaciterrae TaxID=400768 RepID=A0ABS2RH25_9ACTN|nr:AMP-binding protein [Microlunatus panaciterrae]MBM7798314.1 fatty-acyl-CoA synthase [Microlunatus panaciterrae]
MIGDLAAGARSLRRHSATIAAAASFAAERRPEQTALVDRDGSLSTRQLLTAAYGLAQRWIWERFTGPGQRLGLLAGNNRSFVVGLLAASAIGADVVLLSTFCPQQVLDELVGDLGVAALAVDVDHAAAAATVTVPVSIIDPTDTGTPSAPPRPPRPGRLVMLTSGTTRRPRGSGRDTYGPASALPAMHLARRLGMRSGASMMIMPPLFHGFGLGFLTLGLICGAPVLLPGRVGPHETLHLLDHHRVSILVAVPPTLAKLAEAQGSGQAPGQLRAIVTGSSPLHPRCSEAVQAAFGPVLFNLYGCTEAGWATIATPAELLTAPGTVGRPAPGVRVKIINGEIWVASPLATRSSGRRLRGTGDLGHYGPDGLLFLDGRRDDMVVVGGENVFLGVVRAALEEHPAVTLANVRALPDIEFGSRLHARVTCSAPAPSAAQLLEFVSERLPPAHRPRELSIVDEHGQPAG